MSMLIQSDARTQFVNSTSVECLFSNNPSYRRTEEEEEIQCLSSACSQKPPCLTAASHAVV